jgi:Cu(I)/Ag(I) efflux system membrane fusion protein
VELKTKSGVYFKMRQVTLGADLGDNFVIDEGLKEGEKIAVNGAFSIDAAAQLAGKPSMMSTTDDMTGMTMQQSTSAYFRKQLSAILQAYLILKNDLVKDNAAAAIKAETNLLTQINKVNNLNLSEPELKDWQMRKNKMQRISSSTTQKVDIKEQRARFILLSKELIALAQKYESDNGRLYIEYCPMADAAKGAFWISEQKEIFNPFFGSSMLKCGEVRDSL